MERFIQTITMEQLEGDALQLAETIGLDAFKKIVEIYGGSNALYVPRFTKLRNEARDREIIREYLAGVKAKHLAHKYQISERRIHQIIKALSYE